MNIYVDESGTFTTASDRDAWCVVTAYISPESNRKDIETLIKRLRYECSLGADTKLKHLSETRFIKFLDDLRRMNGLVFAAAVDVSLHNEIAVAAHRDAQADKVITHKGKMHYEAGRHALINLSGSIRKLPTQLYTQLICQIELFHKVLTHAPLYYVQRQPSALRYMRWKVDAKNKTPTPYEVAFKTILPAILQTKSFEDPIIMLEGANYSHFNRFEYAPGAVPEYLKKDYGINITDGLNIGMMVRENFKFVDSNLFCGVQVADLLASGLRRLLRGEFEDQEKIAELYGANMVQSIKDELPIKLISLDQSEAISFRNASLIKLMASHSRPMLTN
ncbi:MAG: DUF3800 domain-containing protein [Burkholderiaceae bacterium]